MPDVVRAQSWGGFRDLTIELGGDPDAILAEVGVNAEMLSTPDAYIPYGPILRALEIAAQRLACADFGLRLGLRQGAGTLGPISVAAINCETARQGLECVIRHIQFHNKAVRIHMERIDDEEELIWQELLVADAAHHLQQVERVIAFQHDAMARLAGAAYAPRDVWFTHAPISPRRTYENVFGIAPRFRREKNGIVVARAALDAVQPGRSAHLRRLALQYMEGLRAADGADVSARVRAALRAMMPGASGTQADVAQTLGLHERTLQRRLRDENETFERIKDDVRRELAETYLQRRNLSLTEVSSLLGYAEASAFSRSCKRWFGESPREIRLRSAA